MGQTWQEELADNVTDVGELSKIFLFSDEELAGMRDVTNFFPMSIPRYYLGLIDPDDPADPIRKMCIPATGGLDREGLLDQSGEASNTVLPGMQHKYRQTVLILTSNQCGMYCRYCFRRRLVGLSTDEVAAHLDEMVTYIKSHPEITNVLLSGGDALMNSNEAIERYLAAFCKMPQLDFVRLGSRAPVSFPCRVTEDPELTEMLGRYQQQKQLYVITHFNHPHEFSKESFAAIKALQKAGLIIKNQTVLLRGVNDDPAVLAEVFRSCTRWGIVQHYVFQCRPVLGVLNRFQVPLVRGSKIVNAANAQQNGLGKSADYTMSHVTGKIRILGSDEDGRMVFQYKQAKDPKRVGQIFSRLLAPDVCWLEDL
jgi:KamA family protein